MYPFDFQLIRLSKPKPQPQPSQANKASPIQGSSKAPPKTPLRCKIPSRPDSPHSLRFP